MTKNIKWCAIQPLTGGMYLGAEKVIGHPAEFILSYPEPAAGFVPINVQLDCFGRLKPQFFY